MAQRSVARRSLLALVLLCAIPACVGTTGPLDDDRAQADVGSHSHDASHADMGPRPDDSTTTADRLSPNHAISSDDAGPHRAETGDAETRDAGTPAQPDCTPTVAACDRSIYDRAQAYAEAHPTHDGGTWNQFCASLAYRFSNESHPPQPTAIAAYHASHIVSTDATAARIGAYHYWSIAADGHVAIDLLGGGTTVFMASNHITTVWGNSIGTNSVSDYSSASGAHYLGWSMDYAGSVVTGGGGPACGAATALPAGCPITSTATETTGVPDTGFWALMQTFAAANAYTGPINGIMGPNSWAGVQRGLRADGYTGPDNGIPGVFTYEAMQRVAAMYGYTGPVNGVLGVNSYRGFAAFLIAQYAH